MRGAVAAKNFAIPGVAWSTNKAPAVYASASSITSQN